MNRDDQIYALLLVVSIPIGFVFKHNKFTPRTKALISSLIGVVLALIACWHDIVHSLVVTLVNACIIKAIHPKYVHCFSFIWCFGYLLFFRMTTLFGLPQPVAYANAVQLILTLKAVGLAFEVHDTFRRLKCLYEKSEELQKKQESPLSDAPAKSAQLQADIEKLQLEKRFYSLEPTPSFFYMVCYCFCYVGLLTGPYYKYRTYVDWLQFKNAHQINWLYFIVRRGKTVPFIVIGFLVLSKFFSFQDALDDKFYENSSLAYRLIYMSIIFTIFRFRFYVAWIFAEFSCITASFGAYPTICKAKPGVGPTDLMALKSMETKSIDSYNFNTVHNIDEYECETSVTVKKVLHFWNMTVQFWMANYIYKRVPKRSGQPLTMAVSAYWHGLHPGYYLSMLTTTPCIIAETLMEREVKQEYIAESYHSYYDWCSWMFRARLFDYMAMGFILLTFDRTWRYWSSVYFAGHALCAILICVGLVLRQIRRAKSARKTKRA